KHGTSGGTKCNNLAFSLPIRNGSRDGTEGSPKTIPIFGPPKGTSRPGLSGSGKVHEPVHQVSIARRYRYQVAMLRRNRQTNIEATPILYDDNLFILFELDWLITNPELKDLTRPSITLSTGHRQRKAVRKRVGVSIRLSEHDESYTERGIRKLSAAKHEKQLDTVKESILALGGLCNIRSIQLQND
ncbi:MAG: hypothetical protein Q9196_006159, partial [Gyalolechia fulgens]